jgi:hypothetical protein
MRRSTSFPLRPFIGYSALPSHIEVQPDGQIHGCSFDAIAFLHKAPIFGDHGCAVVSMDVSYGLGSAAIFRAPLQFERPRRRLESPISELDLDCRLGIEFKLSSHLLSSLDLLFHMLESSLCTASRLQSGTCCPKHKRNLLGRRLRDCDSEGVRGHAYLPMRQTSRKDTS